MNYELSRVIASEAKQSRLPTRVTGLQRRFAPRNDAVRCGSVRWLARLAPALLVLVLAATPALAQGTDEYRQFLGLDSRKLVWFLAQMHLFFGAFVLGVPLFAVIIEVIGWRGGDKRFDKLAYEFTSLLSVAYATTAAFGGLLAFALFTLYPKFMGFMAGTF